MITKFKLFEELNEGEPKLGDYVICCEQESGDDVFDNFLLQNIGQIIARNNGNYDYGIKYNDVPKEVLFYFGSQGKHKLVRPMTKDEIIYWSENKEDLEPYIQSKKYNL